LAAGIAVVVAVCAVLVEAVDAVLVEVVDLQVQQAVYMPGKCGSTTAYIVLHNSMDYYKLDIGSFLIPPPLIRGNSENITGIKICSLNIRPKLPYT